VRIALEQKLATGEIVPDVITFAGNGEPTIHPDFAGIIDDVIDLRDRYAPSSKVSVLSNATMLHLPKVAEALKKTDLPILKLDAGSDAMIGLLNHPAKKIPVQELVDQLKSFNGQCVIQTMFLRGTYNGQLVDNTLPEALDAWEQAILDILPKQVMAYTIARDTPADGLCKASEQTLREIAFRIEKHGIPVQVSP
jgi:wyosine [tRNA(Phe)-imidazoG37] synthetase (radical SAM superfamily)